MKHKLISTVVLFLLLTQIGLPVYAAWPETPESIQSAPTSISTTILPVISLTRVGEHHINVSSSSASNLTFTTRYLPLAIIGSTQARTKLTLSYSPLGRSSPTTTLTTTSYLDGSFAFSVPKLSPNEKYSFLLTTTGAPSEAKITFQLIYLPLTVAPSPSEQPIAIYPQLPSHKLPFYFIFLILNVPFLFILLWLYWDQKKKGYPPLLVFNSKFQPQPNYHLVLLKNNAKTELKKSNSQGKIALSAGCYQIFDPHHPSSSALPTYFLDPYLVYKNGTFCITKHQISWEDKFVNLSKVKGVIYIIGTWNSELRTWKGT